MRQANPIYTAGGVGDAVMGWTNKRRWYRSGGAGVAGKPSNWWPNPLVGGRGIRQRPGAGERRSQRPDGDAAVFRNAIPGAKSLALYRQCSGEERSGCRARPPLGQRPRTGIYSRHR